MKKRIFSVISVIVSIFIMVLIIPKILFIVEKFYSLIPVPEKVEEYCNAFMGLVMIFFLILIPRFIARPIIKVMDLIFMPSK